MSLEVIVPIIALIGVLVLVLPGFIQTNYNLKILIKNLSVWIIVIGIMLIFIYLILSTLFYSSEYLKEVSSYE